MEEFFQARSSRVSTGNGNKINLFTVADLTKQMNDAKLDFGTQTREYKYVKSNGDITLVIPDYNTDPHYYLQFNGYAHLIFRCLRAT